MPPRWDWRVAEDQARTRPALVGWLLCQLLRRPRLLRAAAAVLRRWPLLSRLTHVLARRDAVVAAFARSASFSNTAHAPNMVAGEFVIGIQDGPRHDRERRTLAALLISSPAFGEVSGELAQARVGEILAAPDQCFDLVTDYLAPLVWQCLQQCLGDAGGAIACDGAPPARAAEVTEQLLRELRHVGAHLLVGSTATPLVQGRAEADAAALNARVAAQLPALRTAREEVFNVAEDTDRGVQRSGVGMMWVAHPATVQAGAHALIELLARPALYDELRAAVAQAGANPWTCPTLRAALGPHVLELLRFRPPFPLLVRDVPRRALLQVDDDPPVALKAGASLFLLVIGALFDPEAVPQAADYDVQRRWPHAEDPLLVFGFGPRSCPAKRHVQAMLVSLMIGLLRLPRLSLDGSLRRCAVYDGPALTGLALRY